ncbi:MAG: ECF transporter S component [Nitrososphaerota archaeon]|nr:ECF transporter S component [Nitrososphaerota archaeon]
MVRTREVAGATIFTAFVFVTTFSFAVTTSTGGYFDVGEIMVYITALVMGPYVGAFAGGVGSALSDALLAPQFAPGTLIIKAAEGFIVGYLGRRGFRAFPEGLHKKVGAALGLAVAGIVLGVGLISFPDASLLFGQAGFTPTASTADVPLSVVVWLLTAVIAFGVTYAASSKIGPKYTWIALAILAGGAEMVAGYFLYETGVLQIGLAAPLAEIPVNALQAIAGLVVAPPVASRVQGLFRREAPQLRESPGNGTGQGGAV